MKIVLKVANFFSHNEDVALCRSYLAISEDLIIEVSQPHVWRRIKERLDVLCPPFFEDSENLSEPQISMVNR